GKIGHDEGPDDLTSGPTMAGRKGYLARSRRAGTIAWPAPGGHRGPLLSAPTRTILSSTGGQTVRRCRPPWWMSVVDVEGDEAHELPAGRDLPTLVLEGRRGWRHRPGYDRPVERPGQC